MLREAAPEMAARPDCVGELGPVERYEQVGRLYIHFLSDGSVRAISSNISPGYGNEEYRGPHDAISGIRPSEIYGAWSLRCPVGAPPVLTESLDK